MLNRRRIHSYDGIYDFNLFTSSISVYKVDDDALADLKLNHPAEFVRMASAGMEGEVELVKALERDSLFEDARGEHLLLYWLALGNSWFYLYSGTQLGTDAEINGWMAQEPTQASRDFDGHDFTSWVYDLHRPDEPYAARGQHPLGLGIHRYILVSQLSRQERDYLDLQSKLYLLNALDPALFGFSGFWVRAPWDGQPLRFNLAVRHELTPFGFVVELDGLFREDPIRLALSLRTYVNNELGFPGLEASLWRLPLTEVLSGSARVGLWLQPKNQLFRDKDALPGGLLALRLDARVVEPVSLYVEVEGKTAGWVAGNEFLDASLAGRFGVCLFP